MPQELRSRAKLALLMALRSPDAQLREGLMLMAVELLEIADGLEIADEIAPSHAADRRSLQHDPKRN